MATTMIIPCDRSWGAGFVIIRRERMRVRGEYFVVGIQINFLSSQFRVFKQQSTSRRTGGERWFSGIVLVVENVYCGIG